MRHNIKSRQPEHNQIKRKKITENKAEGEERISAFFQQHSINRAYKN